MINIRELNFDKICHASAPCKLFQMSASTTFAGSRTETMLRLENLKQTAAWTNLEKNSIATGAVLIATLSARLKAPAGQPARTYDSASRTAF
jgi:hypothetical protein